MNWTIVARKFLEGAIPAGIAAAGAIAIQPGDANYWPALGVAFVTGALRGGLNAWKHL